MRLASVGNISVHWMPCSSMSPRRASGSLNAAGVTIGLPVSSRRVLPSGLSPEKKAMCAPGAATTSNVGFGMKSLRRSRTTTFLRPLSST